MAGPRDYYAILGIQPNATPAEIRTAYKLAALRTHPDRLAHNDPARATRTREFQRVNDAYYTLSDPGRRREYDRTRAGYGRTGGGFGEDDEYGPDEEDVDNQWGSAFEEMMRDAGMEVPGEESAGTGGRKGAKYSILGGVSGAVMGFIVGNIPGALVGAAAGGAVGGVRDRSGKAVVEVWRQLDQGEKMRLLMTLAGKFLGNQGGSGGLGF
ncbi:DnaJ-domain-containing protein [Ascobolus immersus RN42]|uniref:DnaJ-domain-containing protein n=1 Tax=Ascobolus immersus RN42 TaxID=1160509 RepID=A0A3N4HZH6_ASCIM|nr:DnaJ-domain-containing protein [Ascobolus immersus RN42]